LGSFKSQRGGGVFGVLEPCNFGRKARTKASLDLEPDKIVSGYLEPWIEAMEPKSPEFSDLEPWSPPLFRPEPWSPKSLWDSEAWRALVKLELVSIGYDLG